MVSGIWELCPGTESLLVNIIFFFLGSRHSHRKNSSKIGFLEYTASDWDWSYEVGEMSDFIVHRLLPKYHVIERG